MSGIPAGSSGDIAFLCAKSIKYPFAFVLNFSGWIKRTIMLNCRRLSFMYENVMLLQAPLERVCDTW